MALPLPPILSPQEVAFLCEMESVTIVPRQRLDSLELLGGPTEPLRPPRRASLPLWLALLLKRQRRANIVPPAWMSPSALTTILQREMESEHDFPPPPASELQSQIARNSISAPFLNSHTATADEDALPYHWLEMGEILLDACSDDVPAAGQVRGLLRDLREVRMAKMRAKVKDLEGGGILPLQGVGAMEVAEGKAFITGAVDALRKIGSSREATRRQREMDEGGLDEDEDEDMGF